VFQFATEVARPLDHRLGKIERDDFPKLLTEPLNKRANATPGIHQGSPTIGPRAGDQLRQTLPTGGRDVAHGALKFTGEQIPRLLAHESASR
jgi:hypothetical protein